MAGQGSQVKKSCACCRRYMDHLRGKMTSFLMLMSANYRHGMTMPARFMNQFGGEISESIEIESPDGSVYAIKGTKYMNKMLPQCGWKEFVDAHPIEVNDSLLFQHIEKARFKVLIIDPDGCEKVLPCVGIRISSSSIQERDTDYVDVSVSSHDCNNKLSRVRKRVSSCQGDCPSQRRKAARITKISVSSSEESGVVKMRRPGKRSMERNADFCSNHNDDEDKYFFKFLVGDFRERLVIPDKFVQHFRGLIANSVKLESWCGHTFDVEVAKNQGKVVLQTGWKAFVTAYDLNMGDFLVFKYDRTSRLKVLIFDLTCCEKVPPCCVKRNHIRGRARREEHIEISSSCGDLPTNVTASSSTSLSDSSGDSVCSEDQKSHCVPGYILPPFVKKGYILPRGTNLTWAQMKKLKERVRARTSTIPIYGCIMKNADLRRGSQAVDIPRVYADVYLPFDEDRTLMLQCCGKSWEVRCIFRKGELRVKRLSQGWKQFARDNKLQLGDLCLFELLKNTKYTMNMHVIREK